MAQLETRNIVKIYGSRTVVDGISLRVDTGTVVGLLGPNGAGKTTTFYSIVGFIKPNEGSVMLDGENITDLPIHKRALKGITYLAQEPPVFKKLTVEEHVRIVLEPLGLTTNEINSCWPIGKTNTRETTRDTPCRAASGAGWKSCGHWPPDPSSSCSTSRLPASTRWRWVSCRRSFTASRTGDWAF